MIESTLAGDRETITRIAGKMDEIDGELSVAQRRAVVFAKRLSTDTVLMALSGCVVIGAVGAGLIATGVI